MKKLLLSIFAAAALNASAQTPTFESVQKFNCDSVMKIFRSTTDDAGNVYIGGYYVGTADFDPSTTTNNQTTTNYTNFIQKQTSTGTILWTKFGTDINGLVNHFDVDPSGNVYLLGYFAAVYDANFGSGTFNLTSNGSLDYFVTKLDSQGEFVWATSGGGENYEIGEKIRVNENGEAYVAVLETTTVAFFGSSSNSKDLKIIKLNSSGTQVWASNFTNGSGDFAFVNLELDQNNNPITSGRLRGLKDFDPTNGQNILGSNDVSIWDEFLVKLVDATGAVSWANILNGTSNSLISRKLAVDNQGNCYTYGRLSSGQVDFDASSNVAYSVGPGGFLHKTTASGQHAWTKIFVGEFGEIDTDNQGNVYVFVNYIETLRKYDTAGNDIWNFVLITGDAQGEINSLHIDDLGSIYLAGNGNAYNGDETQPNVASLSFNGSNVNGQISFTNSLENSGEGFWAKFSQCLLSDAITLNGTTISATQSGANYQWINCTNNTPISGATSQTFTATTNGSYAVVITSGACSDTSECTTFSTIGLNENKLATFSIFPNPATEQITISNIEAGSTVVLVDVTGKTVSKVVASSTAVNVETSNFTPGVYFVSVSGLNGTQKLIIE